MKKSLSFLLFLLLVAGAINSEFGAVAQAQSQTQDESCQFLSSYLKFGQANNVEDVYKLQAYLHLVENINVSFNGVFDAATFQGVKTMQARHAAKILTPWGATTPTGNVYITTKHFLDEWSCERTLPYTAEEQRILNSPRTSSSLIGQTSTARPVASQTTGSVAPTVAVTPSQVRPTQTITLPTTTQTAATVNTGATNTGATTSTSTNNSGTTTDDENATSTGMIAGVRDWIGSARGSTIVLVLIVLAIMYFLYNAFSRKDGTEIRNNPNQGNRPNQQNPNQQRNQNNQRR